MKILMTTTSSSLMDGINRHILTVSGALSRRGIEVAVCITHSGGELAEALEAAGVRVYSLNARNGHDIRILWRLDRVMKDFKPDIVHIHVLPFMSKVLFSIKCRDVKFIATCHGMGDTFKTVPIRLRLENFLSNMFRLKVVAMCYISQGVCDYFLSHCGCQEKIFAVIYNPIDVQNVKRKTGMLRNILGLYGTETIIGTACRFAWQKNPQAFMEVMCQVLSKQENSHAVLLGDGDEIIKIEMREIMERYHCSNRVHWMGYRRDAADLMRDFDCFIMTSRWEGLPTALLEAMSAKTPIAFWKGDGGLRDLAALNERSGPIAIVAENGDVAGLADQIVELLGDAKRREEMSERALATCKANFGVDAVIPKLLQVYQKVLSE